MFCSKCGNEMEDNTDFCSKCGNKLKNTKQNLDKKPTKTDSGVSTKKIFVVGLVVVIVGFGILQYVALTDPLIFGNNAVNFQVKKAECDANNDPIYVDSVENFCCVSETHTRMPQDGPMCPLELELIYP